MLVRNENFQEQDLNSILGEMMYDFNTNPNVEITEKEAQQALSEMVYEGSLLGNRAMLKNQQYAMPEAYEKFRMPNVVSNIWDKLLEAICPKFDEETEQDKIAENVAEVVSELVPYRIIIKPLFKTVLFFILKNGHAIVCKTKEAE